MGKKILIVEDEDAQEKAIHKKLGAEGYTVLSASDGKEGLALALEQKPDLIISDIVMPYMDGMDMLDALRQDPWGKDAPVIVLSNLNDEKYQTHAKEMRVLHYFVKSETRLDQLVGFVIKHCPINS